MNVEEVDLKRNNQSTTHIDPQVEMCTLNTGILFENGDSIL